MTLWTHRKGTVSLATRRKLWEHLLCSVLLCPSPAQPATCHLWISFSLTFYEVQTGQFLPCGRGSNAKKVGRRVLGRESMLTVRGARGLHTLGCRRGVLFRRTEFRRSSLVYQPDPVLFKYQISPPQSLGSATGFQPPLLTCLCKAAQGLSCCFLPFYTAATRRYRK